ncbi:hypothetical protein DFH07DRAFT_785885 [Mycena maculata]|uniref:Uncharacterized protein n=1 Tax=Mycena maculata TaxID=230809 RepID=A0AAD7H6K1_9AGAR|nr:hypothetical protein DFH07DRAFT_785885 [Mycena maculata]
MWDGVEASEQDRLDERVYHEAFERRLRLGLGSPNCVPTCDRINQFLFFFKLTSNLFSSKVQSFPMEVQDKPAEHQNPQEDSLLASANDPTGSVYESHKAPNCTTSCSSKPTTTGHETGPTPQIASLFIFAASTSDLQGYHLQDQIIYGLAPTELPVSAVSAKSGVNNSTVPFFLFSGPDPLPVDIGTPGDVYVAPTATYAYLPVHGADACAWSRWTAVGGPKERSLNGSEPGLLVHPHIPDRILWVRKKISTPDEATTLKRKTACICVAGDRIFVSRSTSPLSQRDPSQTESNQTSTMETEIKELRTILESEEQAQWQNAVPPGVLELHARDVRLPGYVDVQYPLHHKKELKQRPWLQMHSPTLRTLSPGHGGIDKRPVYAVSCIGLCHHMYAVVETQIAALTHALIGANRKIMTLEPEIQKAAEAWSKIAELEGEWLNFAMVKEKKLCRNIYRMRCNPRILVGDFLDSWTSANTDLVFSENTLNPRGLALIATNELTEIATAPAITSNASQSATVRVNLWFSTLKAESGPQVELRPHPCTFPPPQSATVEGITCTNATFHVDVLRENYPYRPIRSSSLPNAKFQIPFFIFSGPDPPPADIGTPGDVYVVPASTLYAYLPVDSEGGAWTQWTAVCTDTCAYELKSTDEGLLRHPYTPERFLWAKEKTFSWFSLSSINICRRAVRQKKLFVADEDAEAAAKVLVALTLQNAGDDNFKLPKKRRTDDGEKPRKKARVSTNSDSDKTFVPRGGSASQEEAARSDWDAFYAKPRSSTRGTKQMKDQAEAIARLEAENEELRRKLELSEAQRLETLHQQKATPASPPPPARMPFHPEFLDFMRETFACEVMQTCNAQRVEAETEKSSRAKDSFTKDAASLKLSEVYITDVQRTIDEQESEIRRRVSLHSSFVGLNQSAQAESDAIQEAASVITQLRALLAKARQDASQRLDQLVQVQAGLAKARRHQAYMGFWYITHRCVSDAQCFSYRSPRLPLSARARRPSHQTPPPSRQFAYRRPLARWRIVVCAC